MIGKLMPMVLFACCPFAAATAQDKIVKTDASEVEATVEEITLREVRFKRFSNPDGPTYVLPVGEIRYIEYPNGERDYFTKVSADEANDTAAGEIMPVATGAAPVTAAASKYRVGDLYSEKGVEGIIVRLDEDEQHGLIMSLDEVFMPWYIGKKQILFGATDKTDGEANMRAIARYVETGEYSWEDFPAFKWCRDKGEGWYLPSVNEIFEVGTLYNGGMRISINRDARSNFNATLKRYGGEGMDRMVDYFTSTEESEKTAVSTHNGIEPPFVKPLQKHQKFLIRAFHKF